MPDPWLYLQAFAIVASASGLLALSVRWPASRGVWASALGCVLGIGFGHVAGYYWLGIAVGWPPTSALERYALIVLPAALLIELLAAKSWVQPCASCALRCVMLASITRVLLHGSVYLDTWTAWQAIAAFTICGLLAVATWLLLDRLATRSPGVSMPLSLVLAIQGTGVAIMLGGYIKGGAAALIAAAALLGVSIACALVKKTECYRVIVGIGLVCLCSLQIIGVFFGRLPMVGAVVLLAAPLLCWMSEAPWVRSRTPSTVQVIRLVLVGVAIATVVIVAYQKFNREFRPLL